MAERALAHIEEIAWIKPIEGADNIELIGVLGWCLIAKKNEFKEKDKAVFIEIDSKCPENDERFEFLASKHYKIKTMKLGKFNVISQGLALPIVLFPEISDKPVGTDVTKELHITYSSIEDQKRKSNGDPEAKYKAMKGRHSKLFQNKFIKKMMRYKWFKELMFIFFGKKNDKPKAFPDWIVKTDETRCLLGNTKIETDRGMLRIADVVNKNLDVKVKGYNAKTNEIDYYNILDKQKFPCNEDIYHIFYTIKPYGIRSNSIECTADHMFFTNDGYVKAEDLHIGDKVYAISSRYPNDILQYIYGMLLGDSHAQLENRPTKNNHLSKEIKISTTQGEKQLEYLKFKHGIFDGHSKLRKGKSGYCDNNVYVGSLPIDDTITNALYEDGAIIDRKLCLTKEYCERLTPISLAIWYLDDGTLRHRNEDGFSPAIELSTNSFDLDEINLLIDTLINNFDISCKIRKEGKYNSIYITTEGTYKFLKLISKYIPYDMRYKTIPEFENVEFELENVSYKKFDQLIPITIKDIAIQKHSKFSNHKFTYDLEVENVHNFFANKILTHNCENAPWVLESTDKWIKTEKLDGTSCTFALDCTKRKPDFIVCSRNVRQLDREQACYHDSNIYWELADKYDVQSVLTNIMNRYSAKRVVIQGEGLGNVQGNPYKLTENDLYVFNVIIDGRRLNSINAKDLIEEYSMKFVPIIDSEYEIPHTMEEMKLEADGKSVINPKVDREGFVYRSLDGQNSFKNVSRSYLLKHNG